MQPEELEVAFPALYVCSPSRQTRFLTRFRASVTTSAHSSRSGRCESFSLVLQDAMSRAPYNITGFRVRLPPRAAASNSRPSARMRSTLSTEFAYQRSSRPSPPPRSRSCERPGDCAVPTANDRAFGQGRQGSNRTCFAGSLTAWAGGSGARERDRCRPIPDSVPRRRQTRLWLAGRNPALRSG